LCHQDRVSAIHTTFDNVHTLDELRHFIHTTLCEKENLLVGPFTMTEFELTRGKEPCGIQFSLRGPCDVRLGAVWVRQVGLG
jgi:hypothetical protein